MEGLPFPIHILVHTVHLVQVQWMTITHGHGGSTTKGPMQTWMGTVTEGIVLLKLTIDTSGIPPLLPLQLPDDSYVTCAHTQMLTVNLRLNQQGWAVYIKLDPPAPIMVGYCNDFSSFNQWINIVLHINGILFISVISINNWNQDFPKWDLNIFTPQSLPSFAPKEI